jgi:hypothetical protein
MKRLTWPGFLSWGWNIPVVCFAGLLGSLYGILFTAQVLGMLKIYTAVLAVPLTVVVSVATGWLYLRLGGWQFLHAVLDLPDAALGLQNPKGSLLNAVLLVGGMALVLCLIVVPVAGWPYTPISETLHWDAGIYHFPKALEMVKTGSAWDLTISYGDYPYGYESLFAFSALLTRDGSLFGAAHLLTCLYLWMTLWLLLRRVTGLPPGVVLFLSSFLLLSGVFPEIESNLWWIYKFLIYTIGKNDLFLGAALLGMLLHAPVGARQNWKEFYPFGLAVTGMIAVATKPNALPVALIIWLLAALFLSVKKKQDFASQPTNLTTPLQRANRQPSWSLKIPWRLLLGCGLVMLPGILWMGRNLVVQGTLFSGEATRLQEWSIAYNLANPLLYQYMPRSLLFVCLILLGSVGLSWRFRHIHWSMNAAFALLLAGFFITPASGFFGSTTNRPEIGWRFAVAALGFAFVLPVVWFSPVLKRVWNWFGRRLVWQAAAALLVAGFSVWIILSNSRVMLGHAANAVVLQDQFRQSVGTNGYFSAYDYIHREVKNKVVWVENGLPFYAYGPGFTNSTTRSVKCDYLVVFQTAWFGGNRGYPDYTQDPAWQKNWILEYQDSEGRVYKRVK